MPDTIHKPSRGPTGRGAWRRDLPTFIKVFLALYVPLAAVLVAVTWPLLQMDVAKRMATLESRETSHVQVATQLLGHDIESITSDLRTLASSPSVQRLVNGGGKSAVADVEALFTAVAENKHFYDQVRLLNAAGREVVRVNLIDGRGVVVPSEELQDKARRYYFRDTFRLAVGEVYVSPLDLNIEHGRIEIPLKPMLRIGTPVAQTDGSKAGIVLLNYLGDVLLENFRWAMGQRPHPMLVNDEGYWLSHPDPQMRWGFMFGNDNTFGRRFPNAWKTIAGQDTGSLTNAEGMFTFDSVRPLSLSQYSSTGSADAAGPSVGAKAHDTYVWKVISWVPPADLPQLDPQKNRFYLTAFAGGLLLLALPVGILAAATVTRQSMHREIVDNEVRLREITANLGEGVYVLDEDGLVTFVNPEAERLLQWSEAELLGRNGHDAFHYRTPSGESLSAEQCPVHRTIKTGQTFHSLNDWVIRKDGSLLPVSIVSTPIFRNGRVRGSAVAFQDIRARLDGEAALRESEERFRSAMEYTPIGMALIDLDGCLVQVNQALSRIVAYPKNELEGLSLAQLYDLEQRQAQMQEFDDLINRNLPVLKSEQRYLRRDAQPVWVQLTATVVHDQGGRPLYVLAQMEDVTERKRDQERIRQLAYYDTLTGLPNRRLLLDRFDHALSQAKRFHRSLAVMFLDLDHFKQINDTLGHHVGDQLLQEVATRLSTCTRAGDTVARQGGDEFVIVLTEIEHPDDAGRVAQKVLEVLQASPVTVENQQLPIAASIGIAIYPIDGPEDAPSLMKQADIAMYRAKGRGRNQYCFFHDDTDTPPNDAA